MKHPLISFIQLDTLLNKGVVEEILKTNEYSTRYGLILTHADAIELVETRNEALYANGRIEISSATIEKIIDAFCNSSYITQQDYASTLHELLETFYYMKNETLDSLPDDELIELMKNYFENRCKGSLELLKGREMEKLARNIRYGIPDYNNVEEKEDTPDDEEEEF